MTFDWITALGGAIIGGATALFVRLLFDRYSRHQENRRYAAALAHEVQRIADKLDRYALDFEAMMGEYDEDRSVWPYQSPPRNPITNDDFMIHRSMIGFIGVLSVSHARKVLDFYDHVRDLDSVETQMYEINPWPDTFKHWVEYRRELREEGKECVRDLGILVDAK